MTRRRPNLLPAVLTLVLATALSLLLAEGIVRALGLGGEVRAHFEPGIYAPDPDLGWVLRASYRGMRLEDDRRVPTSTNALGFRGPDWGEARRSAGMRVLVLGDSCSFGLGVGDDETYPAHLERELREAGHDAAVFNAGVPGYGTDQEAAVLRRLSPIVQPHVVIVTWLSNDAHDTSSGTQQRIQVIDGYLVDDVERFRAWRQGIDHRGIYASALYRFFRVQSRKVRDRLGMRSRIWTDELDLERFRPSTDALLEIQRQAEGLGAALVLVTLPRREQLEGSMPTSDLDHMAAFGRAHGLEVVEPLAVWRRRGVHAEGRFLDDNVHLSPAGYRELARAVAEIPFLRR